jgi:hypothetical protein
MATNKNREKNANGALAAEIGAGLLAAAAAAGTGYYFFASDDAKRHRKIAAKWADEMRKEVVKRAKALQAQSPKAFGVIVDEAAVAYASAKNVRREDVMAAARELKKHWDKMRIEFDRSAKGPMKKSIKKVSKAMKNQAHKTKRAVKKVAKKARR